MSCIAVSFQTRRIDDGALKRAEKGTEWLTYGQGYFEQRHTSMTQITPANVKQLSLAWSFELGEGGGKQEGTPLFANGIIYAQTNWSIRRGIDARTGKEIWRYDPMADRTTRMCCGDREKLPILAWGNGGCANSNSGHQNYLSEIASHGYLIVAIGPMQAGGGRGGPRAGEPAAGAPAAGAPVPSGGTLLDAVNWATAQNANPQSPYYRKIDTSKVAVFGHSCGGLQALEVSPDQRVKTTLVVDSGILNSPAADPVQRQAHKVQPDPAVHPLEHRAAQAVAERAAAICPACLRSRRSTLRNFTRRSFTSSVGSLTLRTPTAWTISNASRNFPSSWPTKALATAEHLLSPTAATGRWLLSHGSSGSSGVMRKPASFLPAILRAWPGRMAGRWTRRTFPDGRLR